METMNNNQKKENIFKRFGNWYKDKYEKHPVLTVAGTVAAGVAGAAGVTAVGVAIHKALKPVTPAEVAADNVEALADGLMGVEPVVYDLPGTLGFDTLKIVNGSGEVLADACDMGGDYIVADHFNLENVKKIVDAATEVVEDVAEATVETIVEG